VAVSETSDVDERFLPTGDEAGTAPADRRFRPDVEGLRAVAVLLVVCFHAGVTWLTGGFVGVDVFFVISGFVITGVLLRERDASGRVSILGFYGRRARRIIPAATLVIIAACSAAYVMLGVIYGNQTATDARWASVFLANFHFSSIGTNYLTSTQPPSPLQNFWSLAVEEQFYLVYPAIFILVASLKTKLSLAARLALTLGVGIVASFVLSVVQTSSDPTVAYFSPFTRAWELALGALVAVGTRWLLSVPRRIGAVMGWVGLAAIAFSALEFTRNTPYPGAAVAIPVIGTALVIAGGMTAPAFGAESLLRLAPFQWMGKLSYSIYLWHWPILIIAAYAANKTSLPFSQNGPWLLMVLVLSVATYLFIENPIRHARVLTRRKWPPVVLGLALIATSLGVATLELRAHADPISSYESVSSATLSKLVAAAPSIKILPSNLEPSLGNAPDDWGRPAGPCWIPYSADTLPDCSFGDPNGSKTMVLFGDSHAAMWFSILDSIASKAHWKLVWVGKSACPVGLLSVMNPAQSTPSPYVACDNFHRFSVGLINRIHPNLLIVSQEPELSASGKVFTRKQWQRGLLDTFDRLTIPKSRILVLGNIPTLRADPPTCLSQHTTDIQACSAPLRAYLVNYNRAEQTAATSVGGRYVDMTPWFCSRTCTAVVGKYEVYINADHVTKVYTFALGEVLAKALQLQSAG